jgi:hypothetical protein
MDSSDIHHMIDCVAAAFVTHPRKVRMRSRASRHRQAYLAACCAVHLLRSEGLSIAAIGRAVRRSPQSVLAMLETHHRMNASCDHYRDAYLTAAAMRYDLP